MVFSCWGTQQKIPSYSETVYPVNIHIYMDIYIYISISWSKMELWGTVTTSRVQIHSLLMKFRGLISHYYDIQMPQLQLTLLHALYQRFFFVLCYFLRLKISSLWFMSSLILAFFKLLCLHHFFLQYSFPNGHLLKWKCTKALSATMAKPP